MDVLLIHVSVGVCRLWPTFLNASSHFNCKSLEQIPKGYGNSVLIALRKQTIWYLFPFLPVMDICSSFSTVLLKLILRLLENIFNDQLCYSTASWFYLMCSGYSSSLISPSIPVDSHFPHPLTKRHQSPSRIYDSWFCDPFNLTKAIYWSLKRLPVDTQLKATLLPAFSSKHLCREGVL